MWNVCVTVPCLLHLLTVVTGHYVVQKNEFEARSDIDMLVQEMLRELTMPSVDAAQMQNSNKPNNSVCSCVNYTCGCCLHLEVVKVNLNHTGCVNMVYLPDQLGLEVDLTLDGRVVFRREISVKNPPAVCAEIPYLHNLASLCVRFYNLTVAHRQFSGCMKVEVELEGVILRDFDFGCFHIPPGSSKPLLWMSAKDLIKQSLLSKAKMLP